MYNNQLYPLLLPKFPYQIFLYVFEKKCTSCPKIVLNLINLIAILYKRKKKHKFMDLLIINNINKK